MSDARVTLKIAAPVIARLTRERDEARAQLAHAERLRENWEAKFSHTWERAARLECELAGVRGREREWTKGAVSLEEAQRWFIEADLRAECAIQERDAARAQLDQAVGALEELAGDYGCTLREPADVSLPPNEHESCRYEFPATPQQWCYACIASSALASIRGEGERDDG